MKYSDVLDRLQNLINYAPSQSELCIITGIKQSTMSNRANRDSDFSTDEIIKINEFFDVNLFTNTLHYNDVIDSDTSHITLDYYPDIFGSCGTGEFVLSPEKQQIQVPDNVFFKKFSKVKKYSVINAQGDSMQPFIYSGDKLIVEHWSGEQIIDNQVYVFCYDNEIFVKRLTKNINQLIIKSDNTFYDVIKLTGDDLSKIIIVGQIVGLIRDLKR